MVTTFWDCTPAAFTDIDGDGDIDLIRHTGLLTVYKNGGSSLGDVSGRAWYDVDEDGQFEPQRNLMQETFALDGGGSVAADAEGNVYVAWHGSAKGSAKG